MTTTRPGLYPYHDVTGTNVTWPEDSDFLFTGYVAGVTPVPSADHNGKLNRAGFWHQYLDRQGIRNEDWLDTTNTAQLTVKSLTYVTGGNVLTTGAVVKFRGTYLINATRIETDAPFLNPVGGSVMGDPLVFPGATTPGRIWVYAGSNGQPRYESVAAGTPDAPLANEISLIGLDIDALGVVTDGAVVPVTLPLPNRVLTVVLPISVDNDFEVTGATTLNGLTNPGVSYLGAPSVNTLVFGGLFVDESVAFCTAAAGNFDCAIGADSLDTLTVEATSTFNALVTCNADIVLGSSSIDALTVPATGTFQSPVFFQNNVDLGNAAGDALAVNATSTFNAPVIFGTGATSTINALMTFIAAGAPSGGITSDTSADLTWNGRATFGSGGRVTISASTSNAGDIGNDGSNNLQWTDASATKYVHVNPSGWVKGHGQAATTGGAAASVNVDTSTAVAPKVASNLDVAAEAWVSRAAAGTVTVSLTEVGVGQIGTNATRNVVATAANEFTQICFSRTHSASTTARIYRFTVDGGGSNVTVTQARVTVTPVI